jgi:ATP synthase protein I
MPVRALSDERSFQEIAVAAQDDRPGGADIGSDAELARRLDRLSRELDAETAERAAAERPTPTSGKDFAYAFKLASEFVAGVVVGAVLGWGLDRVAGTSPWGLIGFLLLGFAAGVLNVVRASSRISGGGRSG